MTTKKTRFKNQWGDPIMRGIRISSCCGAQLHAPDNYAAQYYGPMANNAAGMGIVLSDKAPTTPLTEHEKLTEVVTRNGVLFFATRHKE